MLLRWSVADIYTQKRGFAPHEERARVSAPFKVLIQVLFGHHALLHLVMEALLRIACMPHGACNGPLLPHVDYLCGPLPLQRALPASHTSRSPFPTQDTAAGREQSPASVMFVHERLLLSNSYLQAK